MVDVQAKFHFVAEAVSTKSMVVKVKTIQLVGQTDVYKFPEEQQTSVFHAHFFSTTVVKGVVKSLTKRNQFRNVIITLPANTFRNEYLDEEGNVVFNEFYLEVITDISHPASPSSQPTQSSQPVKSMHSLAKDMVIENFNGKNCDAESWLKIFTSECTRLNIQVSKRAEALRLFVVDSALEWHTIFMKTNSLTAD